MNNKIYYVYVTTDEFGYYSVHYSLNIRKRMDTKRCPFREIPLAEVLAWWPVPNLLRVNMFKQCLKDNAKDMADIISFVESGDTEAHITIPKFYA